MPGRRGNSEGTITKRADGRWEARVSLPDGKRRCFYGKTRQEVQRKLAQARRAIDDGMPLVDERQTVGQYLLTWLETSKLRIDPSSWDTYETQVRYHIIPALGKYSLAKLTAQQIQLFYAALLEKGLATATVKKIHAILTTAFKDAYKLSMVQRNVLDLVQAPRVQNREMVTFTEEQVGIFLDGVHEERLEALYVLALSTGMRRCEFLALRWQDVDLEQSTLQVRIALQRQHGKFVPAEPKSSYSKRRIALSQTAV